MYQSGGKKKNMGWISHTDGFTLIVAVNLLHIVKYVCFIASFFSRERLEEQFYLPLGAPPVCAKWQGMEVNSGEGGREA